MIVGKNLTILSTSLTKMTNVWEQERFNLLFRFVCKKGFKNLPILAATKENGMQKRQDINFNVQFNLDNIIKYKLVEPGQFVIHLSSYDSGLAHSAILGVTSPAYSVVDFINKENNDDKFWTFILKSKSFIDKLSSISYGLRVGKSINLNELNNIQLKSTNLIEQNKISKLFSLLNSLITLHQREDSQSLNQGCLVILIVNIGKLHLCILVFYLFLFIKLMKCLITKKIKFCLLYCLFLNLLFKSVFVATVLYNWLVILNCEVFMFKKKKLIILALSSSIFSIPAIVISCNQGKKDTNNRTQGNLKEKENFQESKMKIDFGYKELSNVFLVDFLKDLKTKTTLNDDDVIIKDIKPKTINNSENRVIIEITLHSNKFNKDYIFSKEFSGFRHISNGIDSINEQENSMTEVNDERNINFNLNWKFAKETSSNITSIKNNNFDENTLTNIDLPYDWSIYNDFSPNISNEWGALEGGNAWYRKTFEVKKEWKDKQVLIHFGGVYMDSEVYVNGALVGNYPSGYQEFTYDLSKFLNFDDPKNNVIALRAKNLTDSSRWYSGSGIYRDVTLSVKNKLHIDEYGVVITHKNLTKDNVKNIDSTAKYKIVNETNQKATFKIRQTIKTFSDEKVVKEITSSPFELEKGTSIEKNLDFKIDNVKLWDIKNPNLYTLTSEIIKVVDGREEIVDKDVQRYGYRFTNWTSNDGFSLNGKWLKLHGVSMHHDQGALGAVASYDAIYRQMKILKEMGVNAIRSTHNPSDQKLVHICEELGLLLIDEAFDTWYKGKKSQDYHRFFEQKSTHPKATNNQSWAEFDIKQMVRSKINSPAIFMWSIGNEIAESEEVKGTQTTQNLVKWVKEIDTTRYVTWGNDKYRFGNGQNQNVANASEKLDTVGMNYSENNAESLHKIHPDWKIYGSETSSAVKSRGIWYEPEKYDNGTNINSHYGKQQSDYGNNRVGWGKTATESWKFDRDNKWYAGQFIWTGFDYIGEPTPWHGKKGNDEPKSSYFGIVDTAGFPKMDYYLYQSQWLDVKEHPMVKIAPHWTWDDKTKRDFVIKNGKITLRIYSNARKVLLKVDGELLESKTFNVKETNYTNEKGEKIKYQEGENSNELYLKFEVDYEKYKNSTIVAEVDWEKSFGHFRVIFSHI
ncbi:glycoside hydrolase family 2 TIM barrel-domain containing protein [Mycoplasmopsis cynos]|uniref:glycoside hydrolase family 2 TIM barrel-domain containing protein n=2 Tax=Mycoplasmopsis cynos TaxID=171284 RepID=UPI002AFF89A2|nr:glycoside hydrolase family 2 TIM barrel-domain containing protein [Mycoplasmopsis cynos]WQQ19146.1 glycoside hydrolase family 2 TIM barrel-domain containing protein [Mycoplasmopsis cynos]